MVGAGGSAFHHAKDLAAIGLDQTDDGAHQGRLACAVAAEKGSDAPRLDFQRHPVEDADAAVPRNSSSTSSRGSMLKSCAEIGFDDTRVANDVVGSALGDLDAMMKHDDALGEAHHRRHDVLDQEDRQVQLLAEFSR